MDPNQINPGQLRANNQANATSNLIKFEKYNSFKYFSIYSNEKAPITLLNQPSEIFKYIPRNFTITTDNGSYLFNTEMLQDTSSIISKFITENPNVTEYHINIKDDDNVMRKIEDMYNGKKVTFELNELNVLRQITSALNIVCCPKFMKFERFKTKELYYHNKYKNYSVIINIDKFIHFLNETYPKTFTISTNNSEYKCNKLGIKTSSIINEFLEKNPNSDSYHYDFDDEFNIFQEICNFFNFLTIEITTDNVHVLKRMADDLQINCIIESFTNIIESYESSVQKIDEKQLLIDTVDELCSDLYDMKNIGIEKVQEKILRSIWSSTEENIQELACYLTQVVHTDLSLHSYIMDLLMNLDNKFLLNYFIEQIMFQFPKNKLNCAFVFRLIQKGLVSIDEVTTKLIKDAKFYKLNKGKGLFHISRDDNKNDKEKFVSKLTDSFKFDPEVDPLYLKNGIVWFFPELLSSKNEDVESIIKENDFIKKYLPNKIDQFKKMRESYEPEDEISKAIINDDVDTLQKILSQYKSLTNLIQFNLFDSITENGNNTFINYAASKGSIKCFKYLLLNHSNLDELSLYYAVIGQNIEIIRIVDQYCSSNNISVIYKFNSDDFCYKKYFYYDNDDSSSQIKIQSPIIPAITNHQNDLFDWILEQKYLKNSLFDVAMIAVQNGNVHALIQCVNKGFDINSISSRNLRKMIEQSSIFGFNKITQLIFGLLSPKIVNNGLSNLVSFENSVVCGNLSIMKFYFSISKGNYDIDRGLFVAAERGYLHIIKDIFETDSADKIEFKEDSAVNAFAISVFNHQTEIFDYLYYSTALPHVLSENSLFLLLSYFCYLGDFKATQIFTEFILKKINYKVDFSESFLYAAISGCSKICQYLVDRKVLINYSNLVLKSSILTCCNKEIFSILFDSSEPEVKETFVGQLLADSIKNNNPEIVEFLLEKGSSCNNALFEAVSSKNAEIVNIVLKHNSKPSFINKISKNGTALNKAVILGDFEIVKRLLSIPGINPSLYANNNMTPLVSAITSFRLDIINLILDFYGEEIESQTWQLDEALKRILKILSSDERTFSPLNFNNNTNNFNEGEEEEEEEYKETKTNEKSKLILKVLNRLVQIKNIDLNCRENKYTLLTFACETNEIDMVSMLIKSDKVDVNSYAPKSGNTPLMISIENKNIEIVKLLIKLPKTNINMSNYNGKTALTIAVEKNLPEIVDLIISNERFDPEESLLDYSFYISKGQISKQLFELKNLNVNYKYLENEENEYQYDDEENHFISCYYKSFKHDKKKSFETTLIHAVNTKDKEKINLIIKHPSFDPIKSQIKAALFASLNVGNIDIFRSLLSKNNNDVNIYSQWQESLLSFSIHCNCDEIVEEIINNKNFDINKTDILSAFLQAYSLNEQKEKQKQKDDDNDYNSPNNFRMQKLSLIDASIKSMNLICKFDENHNHSIDFSKLLPTGKSFFTTMNPNLNNSGDVASFLLKHGVDPDRQDNFRQYPLKYVIEKELIGAAIVLIRSGKIDLKRRFILEEKRFIMSTSQNSTYLHLAACLKSSEILSELLDQNVIDINTKDDLDETPLIKAIKHKSMSNIKLLFSKDNLDYKCDLNDNFDIIEVAKDIVDYRRNDEVHLESKEDYLEYLIHIIEYGKY